MTTVIGDISLKKLDCKSDEAEKYRNHSTNTKIGIVLSVAILSIMLITWRSTTPHTMSKDMITSTVGNAVREESFQPRLLSQITSSYTSISGGASLVSLINSYRNRSALPPLFFANPSLTNNAGFRNPLTTAASNRNSAWGGAATSVISSNFYSVLPGLTAAAISSSFGAASIPPPTSYKEYDYYGENCAEPLFLIMKNGITNPNSPGYGIHSDLISTKWTNIAVQEGNNPWDAASGSLGKAYFTIIFSTSVAWTGKTSKPTKRPIDNPTLISNSLPTSTPVAMPTPYPSRFPTPRPLSLPTRYPASMNPTVNPRKPSTFPTAIPLTSGIKNPTAVPLINPTKIPSNVRLPTNKPI